MDNIQVNMVKRTNLVDKIIKTAKIFQQIIHASLIMSDSIIVN